MSTSDSSEEDSSYTFSTGFALDFTAGFALDFNVGFTFGFNVGFAVLGGVFFPLRTAISTFQPVAVMSGDGGEGNWSGRCVGKMSNLLALFDWSL